LEVEGSHSLEKFVNTIAHDITDPEKNISVWKRSQAGRLVRGMPEAKKDARTRPDLRIGALGSGSDYTAFVDHLGIASLNVAYGGEDDGGIYHSVYDDFYWFTHFSDRDFIYGRALAQTIGSMVLRFADADVLPYDFSDFADTMHKYDDELKKLLKDHQEEAADRDQNLADGVYAAASDPRRPTFAPPKEELPPFINFAPLDNALAALDRSAARYSKAIKAFSGPTSMVATGSGNTSTSGTAAESAMAGSSTTSAAPPSPSQALQALNQKLIETERKLSSSQGLPRRPWFQNLS